MKTHVVHKQFLRWPYWLVVPVAAMLFGVSQFWVARLIAGPKSFTLEQVAPGLIAISLLFGFAMAEVLRRQKRKL